jgi:hypothetical protein
MMKNLPKVVLALGLYLLPTTFLILALTFTERLEAANFLCPSGNVTCLIAAINEANGNGQDNIIDVGPGVYTLTGTNNVADGPNGLPSWVQVKLERHTAGNRRNPVMISAVSNEMPSAALPLSSIAIQLEIDHGGRQSHCRPSDSSAEEPE